MEKRYTVRQAVTLTGVKSYVLRYWEEELELRIGRNELGHRYYTPFDIQLFLKITDPTGGKKGRYTGFFRIWYQDPGWRSC